MKYNVSQLLLSFTGTTSNFLTETDDLIEGNILVLNGMVVHMYKVHDGIWVEVNGPCKITGTCSRCLNEFEYIMEIKGEQEYISVLDIGTENLETDRFLIDDRHELDITELVRQTAIVSSNVKTLCLDSCRGLCAQCGTNLNIENCNCVGQWLDPRWAALIELTKKI